MEDLGRVLGTLCITRQHPQYLGGASKADSIVDSGELIIDKALTITHPGLLSKPFWSLPIFCGSFRESVEGGHREDVERKTSPTNTTTDTVFKLDRYVRTNGRVNDEYVRSFNGQYVGFSPCAPELNNLLCVDLITLTFKCRAEPAFNGIVPLNMLPNMEFVTPRIFNSNHQKRWKQATTIDRVI
ncbi:unnamed protein product [Lepeophtheirus salmonis]|uniref:(salmon louse) hypothetical protein n=1 Tax=Lepeophtheirus salmonis TaxID=72036 RepID=A0A817FF15_LEPSM|nr:unnamed protein product [Lepeophtheirus salmonis]CAG9477410.1 unnamed protein product [Lepeophtheirus salmonis]